VTGSELLAAGGGGAASWPPAPVRLGSISAHPVTAAAAVDGIVAWARGGVPASIVTPNVDFVCLARRDAAFRRAVNEAALSLVDGMPLVWLAAACGSAVPERIAGSDLLRPLLDAASEHGLRVAILGASEATLDAVSAVIAADHPGIELVHRSSPWFERGADSPARAAAVEALVASRAQLIILGLDSVKQIELQRVLVARGMPAVSVGLGAAFQFLIGERARAPRWMQRWGLEWLHRLLGDPKRLAKRYLVQDITFVPLALCQIALSRLRRHRPSRALAGADPAAGVRVEAS
jgi:N-acetylglucosaminyldiphosphoundecaprenol N-acetyl-beta-D-mannosaminyltransferase